VAAHKNQGHWLVHAAIENLYSPGKPGRQQYPISYPNQIKAKQLQQTKKTLKA